MRIFHIKNQTLHFILSKQRFSWQTTGSSTWQVTLADLVAHLNTEHPSLLFTSAQSAIGHIAKVLPFQADSMLHSDPFRPSCPQLQCYSTTLAPLLEKERKIFFIKIIAPLLATNKGQKKYIQRNRTLYKCFFLPFDDTGIKPKFTHCTSRSNRLPTACTADSSLAAAVLLGTTRAVCHTVMMCQCLWPVSQNWTTLRSVDCL